MTVDKFTKPPENDKLVNKVNEIIDNLDAKQDTLVSGTNIKTINSTSLLGSGDLTASDIVGYTPANDSNVVHLTGNEIISGNKLFTQIVGTSTNSGVTGVSIYDTGTTGIISINSTTGSASLSVLNGRLQKDGSNIITASDLATTSTAGIVQPDGSTITVSNGVISATPARNIGEIVQSTIPLTDAGLHLLDGSLISGSGSYADFVTYIAGLVNDYPDLFETEANWQASVTTYGVCGKFVYDSVNNTVRLPKITGIIEGTVDATALGDLVEAGLPNITGNFTSGVGSQGHSEFAAYGCLYNSDNTGRTFPAAADTSYGYRQVNLDASRSSSIYGNSSTVQPQTIKAFIYIVIATSAKTDIEVDIDEIATDLNGKADTDLSNITATGKAVIDGQWVIVGQAISTANAVGSYSLDISSLLPADNYKYEVILACRMFGSGDVFYQSVYTTEFPSSYVSSTSSVVANLVVIPVGTNRIINYAITSNGNTSPNGANLQLCAYRRIGTNS